MDERNAPIFSKNRPCQPVLLTSEVPSDLWCSSTPGGTYENLQAKEQVERAKEVVHRYVR